MVVFKSNFSFQLPNDFLLMISTLQSIKTSIVQEYAAIPVQADLINKLLNCIDELDHNSTSNVDDKKNIICSFLEDISSSVIDTEDSEYIASKMEDIATALKIDCSRPVYTWLYGSDLANVLLMNTTQKTLIEFVRTCKKCGTEFKFEILEIENSIPDYWRVFKCNSCDSKNIISLMGGIKRYNFQNCNFERCYNKKDYLEEDIQSKIDQQQI